MTLTHETTNDDTAADTSSWQRLSGHIVWVDLALTVITSLPLFIVLLVRGTEITTGVLVPLIGAAAFGVIGAVTDVVRWAVTRYRITGTHVELRTGLIVRRRRSLRHDRVRSVDIEARLRHRVVGLRVVKIGAGQQAAAEESAIVLDALPAVAARDLRTGLLRSARAVSAPETERDEAADPSIARFRAGWVLYNLFNIWAYVIVLGLGWGASWVLGSVGIDVFGWIASLADWEALGWVYTALIAFVAVSVLGAIALIVVFFTEYWNFELSRSHGAEGTQLRTRQGLLTTREVDREENRIRGLEISEPLAWRWMHAADTHVITTGLDQSSMSDPAAILPRAPLSTARRVAAAVLSATPDPFRVPLEPHPRAALRRRLWWASAITILVGVVLLVLANNRILPYASLWAPAAVWPLALGGAVTAYRALGHAITGPYLVARSGLLTRSTVALQRSAVSTVVIQESVLQRRLGLRSLYAMTAAGYGEYGVPDVEAGRAVDLARQTAPELIEPFLE